MIIFDETNAGLVREVLPSNLTVSVFNTRPIQFELTVPIIVNFLFNLKSIKIKNRYRASRGIVFSILWQLQCIYIKSSLTNRKPKAIVTSIDNCSKFAWLSENFTEAPCIAIQNGFRLSYEANDDVLYHCQHLFCFGDREILDFHKMGYKVDFFYPTGSLSASLNFPKVSIDETPEFDLLVVSCWRGNIGYAQDVVDSMTAMRAMDQALSTYLRKRNLKAAVILRSERNSDNWVMPEVGMSEEEYYKTIYGSSLGIIDSKFSERNVYSVMKQSELIVAGFSTTCLIEALGIGKKILYANFFETDKYHSDFNPELVFKSSGKNDEVFYEKLDELLEIPSEEYRSKNEELIKYYMQTPKSNSTHAEIKNKIGDIISGHQRA